MLAGCARGPEDGLDRVRREGLLRVGTDATYPPFESIDSTGRGVVGFDADLIRAVGERMGVRVELIVVPFDGILSSLRAGKFDAVISALTITEERAREVLFSDPYHAAGQSVCVRAGEESVAADLMGRRIGVQLGTTGEMEAQRISGAQVIAFDAIGAAFIDLARGGVDAVIADTPTARLFAREHPEVQAAGKAITTESYGIAVRRSDAALKGEIDRALAGLSGDGTIVRLRGRWGLETP